MALVIFVIAGVLIAGSITGRSPAASDWRSRSGCHPSPTFGFGIPTFDSSR